MSDFVYAVLYTDERELSVRPIFRDRDDGIIYGWTDRRLAEQYASGLFHGRVVLAESLPYKVFVIQPTN